MIATCRFSDACTDNIASLVLCSNGRFDVYYLDVPGHASRCRFEQCQLRGGTGGAKPGSGVQRFWGPLAASEFDPSFQKFGVSETPSQRPLRAPERLSGPRGRLFRGLGQVCLFSKERGKKVGHSEAPKRPRFPGCPPERVPTLGFLPSGYR